MQRESTMTRQAQRRTKSSRHGLGRLLDPDSRQGKRLGFLVTTLVGVLSLVLAYAQFGHQLFGDDSTETAGPTAGTAGLVVSAFSVEELKRINGVGVMPGRGEKRWE